MRTRSGFVLVSVLWVLAILTVITLSFGQRVLIERRLAAYALDHTKALYMARGAVTRGIVELQHREAINSYHNQSGRIGYGQRGRIEMQIATRRNPLLSHRQCFDSGSRR